MIRRIWEHNHWPVMLLLLILLAPARVVAAQADALIIAEGTRIPGDVATIGQSIVVDGEVSGDVTSWSGDITINGSVGGDVVTYTGEVTIGPEGHIEGSVMSMGSPVERNAQGFVARAELEGIGQRGALSSLMGVFIPTPESTDSTVTSMGRGIFGTMVGIFLCAFVLLWGALWPRRTLAASLMLRRVPGRSLVVGALATLFLGVVALPLSGLLTASVLGLPLLVVLLVLLNAPYIYGLATLTRALTLPPVLGTPALMPSPQNIALVGVIAAGIALVTVALPVAGFALFMVVSSPGLGAVILSRAGLLAPPVLQ